MSRQLNYGYRPPSIGYFASDRRSYAHPYQPSSRYVPPPGDNNNNVFNRAARHLTQELPGGDWCVRGRGDQRGRKMRAGRGPTNSGRGGGVDRSGWWPANQETNRFDRASQEMRNALLPSGTWREREGVQVQSNFIRRGPPQYCEICSFQQMFPEKPRAVYHHHFSASNIQRKAKAKLPSDIYLCPTCDGTFTVLVSGKWPSSL